MFIHGNVDFVYLNFDFVCWFWFWIWDFALMKQAPWLRFSNATINNSISPILIEQGSFRIAYESFFVVHVIFHSIISCLLIQRKFGMYLPSIIGFVPVFFFSSSSSSCALIQMIKFKNHAIEKYEMLVSKALANSSVPLNNGLHTVLFLTYDIFHRFNYLVLWCTCTFKCHATRHNNDKFSPCEGRQFLLESLRSRHVFFKIYFCCIINLSKLYFLAPLYNYL